MRHRPMRFPLPVLLLGALLVACGATPHEEPGLEPAESPGELESALCSGSAVSALTLNGISTYQGEMAGSGNWQITAPANGVRLEYFIDNVQQAIEDRPGSSGTWYFSQAGVPCGTHTFQVRAWPMVIDSAGNRTVCLTSGPRSLTQSVTEACTPPLGCNADNICNLSCSFDQDCYTCVPGASCIDNSQ
ncbi:MAG TPA: hypothetical protein VEU33_39440, partial [Archangium sp.]|nr:hypothetical protein [Archangium sp.]